MTPKSLIKIFPSSKLIESNVQEKILTLLNTFLSTWKAHGKNLLSEAFFLNNQFLCVKVNQNQTLASGCSLDTLSEYIVEIEKTFDVCLNERHLIYLKRGEMTIPLALKECINFKLEPTDLVFNLMLTDGDAVSEHFTQPVSGSAYERLF